MEYLILIFSFFQTKEKRIFWINFLCPLLIGVLTFWHSDSSHFQEVAKDLQSDILSVIGVLLGFSFSVFAIFLTSEGVNIEEAKNRIVENVKLLSKPVSLYRTIIISFTYIIIVEGFILLTSIIYPIFFSMGNVFGRLFFAFSVFLSIHCILMTLRLVLDFYFIITKKKKDNDIT